MEKERLLVNKTDGGGTLAWNSSIFMVDNPPSELNCSSELLSDCFFSSSWDPSSMDRNDPFESALSSMVSSPVASDVGVGDGFVIRELIGRLGGISDSGEISPQSRNVGSTNASSYNTPLNSPPKLNLSPVMESRIQGISQFSGSQLPHSSHPSLAPLTADPGFAERAARFSCFGGRNLAAGLAAAPFRLEFGYGSFPELEPGKLSRVSSNQSLKVAAGFQVGAQEKVNSFPSDEKLRQISPVRGEMGDSREGSSVSELNPGGRAHNDNNCRKRKLNTKARAPAKEEKKVARDNENAKRIKHGEDAKKKNMIENCNSIDENGKSDGDGDEKQHKSDNNNNSNIKESAKPAPEPPKDYIHVRARRGQATDSHSLAERVRREKISERMKFLQDLVPGCNKVTGKAVVLDEIINYVQSLQRQVEFLSMKLATVNPEMEFNMEALLSKDSFHSCGSLPPSSMYRGVDSAIAAPSFPYSYQSMPNAYNGGSENPFPVPLLNNSIQRTQMGSVDGFSDSASQVPAFGGGDLHSVIQMSIAQNQTENLEGTKPTACMKVELC